MKAYNYKKKPKHTTKGFYHKLNNKYIYSIRYSKVTSYGYFMEKRYNYWFLFEQD